MKTIIAAIALSIAVPAAAQTQHSQHADHSQHGQPAGDHSGHGKKDGCCDHDAKGKMMECCAKAKAAGNKMECCDKQAKEKGADAHAGHQGH